MNKRTIIISIIVLILLTVLGLWLVSRRNAEKAGNDPLSFRDFFGLSTNKTPSTTPGEGLSSDFTNGNNGVNPDGSSSNGTDGGITTGSSVFTGNGYTPANGTDASNGNNGNTVDVCPNMGGVQNRVPNDRNLDESGNCSVPRDGDICLNVSGIQRTVPTGMVRDMLGACIPVPGGDMCLNIFGTQSAVPAGMTRLSNGNCVSSGQDLCPNIGGTQLEIPAGRILTNGQCVLDSSTELVCSDSDLNITFTPAELEKLQALQEQFYVVAQTLHTDDEAATELANFDAFKAKNLKITELLDYCKTTFNPNKPAYNTLSVYFRNKVPTPYWFKLSEVRENYLSQGNSITPLGYTSNAGDVGGDEQIVSTGDKTTGMRILENVLRLNLW